MRTKIVRRLVENYGAGVAEVARHVGILTIAQHEGPERGLEEIRAIAGRDRLPTYPFYHAALGEFEFRSGRSKIAREHFRQAGACERAVS